MLYTQQNLDRLLGTPGFSDTLLKNHFTLYGGYVTNVNKLVDELATLAKDGKQSTPQYAEMKRRFGWEWNGMKLHELYFGNMANGGKALDPNSALATKLKDQFGSHEAWEKDFRATGAMRGIGWSILYHDSANDSLFNTWVNEHDMGHLAGCTPLLVLDVFEHAYITDYGIKRADYIEAFFKAIDWEVVGTRFSK
ncbi:MAG: superoxide dismutase [Candidatus Colwellbacteria bacterium RIFCSPLOWO2_01_FULL_48_10]|uniref:superoxide dismutase n=2 Tax=Bacteria candidate phyla TaxID=1783234 RepID=A0A1F5NZ53_9BACT|nr:MAG: superoxide dismutase [Candidatus Doudnabacteria bacterium RIFCSPHIGHO2_01_FULL_49_9]OGY59754.1 MAG: superoxide dismutase [Candidatus Colwellbacteria bacterium RIFCSPLOWO2_01_FULL_48_10]